MEYNRTSILRFEYQYRIRKLEKLYSNAGNSCDIFLQLRYCSDNSRVVENHFHALKLNTSRNLLSHLVQSESPKAPTSYFQQNGLRSASQTTNERSVTHPQFVSARHCVFTDGTGGRWKGITRVVQGGEFSSSWASILSASYIYFGKVMEGYPCLGGIGEGDDLPGRSDQNLYQHVTSYASA
jgi:hypothetical protein